ncbi:MAG: GNAT family N-acetyltransferase [Candidatus Hodarchaeales archaeon]
MVTKIHPFPDGRHRRQNSKHLRSVAWILGLELRAVEPSEMAEAVGVFLRAFSRPAGVYAKQIIRLLKALKERRIAHFEIAKIHGAIVGLGGICSYTSFAFIGWMAVEQAFQRLGIANALFKRLLTLAEEANIPSLALFATPSGQKLYEKWGFQGQYYVAPYEILGDGQAAPEEDLKTASILPNWLLTMDRTAFGGDRSKLLKFLADRGKLIVSGRKGFGFVLNETLGPLIAKTAGIAMDIVAYAHEQWGAKRIYVLHHHTLSPAFLAELRLKRLPEPSCLRMVSGKPVEETLPLHYSPFRYATG